MAQLRQNLWIVLFWSMVVSKCTSSGSRYYPQKPHFSDSNHFDHSKKYNQPNPNTIVIEVDDPRPKSLSPIITPPPQIVARQIQKEVSLNFSDVGLTKIKSDFIRTSELLSLYLNNNMIEAVSVRAFRRTPFLQYLDLSWNMINTSQLLSFGHVSNLKTLIIDNNNSAERKGYLAEYPGQMPQLQKCSMRNNKITEFEIDLKNLAPALTHLDLSGNEISSVEFLNKIPATLTHLTLRQNLIKQIDADDLANIVELDLRWNLIEKLCGEDCSDSSLSLSKALKLQKLDLSDNRISDIPEDTFKRLTKLTELRLSNNSISRLVNGTFEGQAYLEHLTISHNKLVQIPNICLLRNLKTLDLSHNQIVEVNGARLCGTRTLKTLLLNNNRILSIQTFVIGPGLDILDLSYNRLTDLPSNWVIPANSPRILKLNNNNITDWGEIHLHNHMQRMMELHLEGNPLMFVVANHLCSYPHNLLIQLNMKTPDITEQKLQGDLDVYDDSSDY